MNNKKRSVLGLNVFIILAAVIYVFVLIIGNVGVKKAFVAIIPGSYGDQYAQDNHLNVVELSDSQKQYFDQRYETFDYDIDDNGNIVLQNYHGTSTDLIIPVTIDGRAVYTLGESLIASIKSVKNLYISPLVTTIEGDPDPTIIICCQDDNSFYIKNKDAGWTFELYHDSDFINFDLGDIPFEYNQNGNNIELTQYTGHDSIVVIPSYINGYPVTDISFNLIGKTNTYVIPETVRNISGASVKFIYSATFAIELFFTLLAFVIALLVVDVIMPRYRKDDSEYLLSGSQIIALILYVVAQTVFGIIVIYYRYCPAYTALIISLLVFGAFIAVMLLGGAGRSHAKAVAADIAAKTSRMKSIKEDSKNLAEGIKDNELRKKVQRVVDEIRFSDPVSRDDLDDLESDIERFIFELKKAKSSGDEGEISTIADELLEIVKERNIRCKSGK